MYRHSPGSLSNRLCTSCVYPVSHNTSLSQVIIRGGKHIGKFCQEGCDLPSLVTAKMPGAPIQQVLQEVRYFCICVPCLASIRVWFLTEGNIEQLISCITLLQPEAHTTPWSYPYVQSEVLKWGSAATGGLPSFPCQPESWLPARLFTLQTWQ